MIIATFGDTQNDASFGNLGILYGVSEFGIITQNALSFPNVQVEAQQDSRTGSEFMAIPEFMVTWLWKWGSKMVAGELENLLAKCPFSLICSFWLCIYGIYMYINFLV